MKTLIALCLLVGMVYLVPSPIKRLAFEYWLVTNVDDPKLIEYQQKRYVDAMVDANFWFLDLISTPLKGK